MGQNIVIKTNTNGSQNHVQQYFNIFFFLLYDGWFDFMAY